MVRTIKSYSSVKEEASGRGSHPNSPANSTFVPTSRGVRLTCTTHFRCRSAACITVESLLVAVPRRTHVVTCSPPYTVDVPLRILRSVDLENNSTKHTEQQ